MENLTGKILLLRFFLSGICNTLILWFLLGGFPLPLGASDRLRFLLWRSLGISI